MADSKHPVAGARDPKGEAKQEVPAAEKKPVDPKEAADALAAFEASMNGEEEAGEKTEAKEKKTEAKEKKTEAKEEKAEAADAKDAKDEKTDEAKAKKDGANGSKKDKKPTARQPVVVFDRVTKTYNVDTEQQFTAIKNVTFTVEDIPDKGEFVAILGPSGCGKSTVLRLIAGLEPQHPPTLGDVLVFGRPVAGPGADRGMVFQSYTSFDNRTVLGNLTFGLECRGGMTKSARVELAEDWIEKVGLSVKHDADKYPHELSGGMQQRVAIARTLILRPRIILMDEPFGALDPLTRMHMQDTLIQLWNGAIILEQVFNWPGLGTLTFQAIGLRDTPVILATVVIYAYLLALTVFLLDIVYMILDPRVRLQGNN